MLQLWTVCDVSDDDCSVSRHTVVMNHSLGIVWVGRLDQQHEQSQFEPGMTCGQILILPLVGATYDGCCSRIVHYDC